ncbi:MAG TPA: glycosyltransferase family 4 protein [Paludibaculum sp.]|jgi:glycosyltransferase involved in cell wall biosynthesis
MKVLITHELFPPEMRGGGELIAFEAAKGLQRRGLDVNVLTSGYAGDSPVDGVPVKRLRISRYLMNLAAPSIERHAQSADVIQTFNYHACLPSLRAARRLGRPVVCVALGLFGAEWRRMRPFPAGHCWQAFERHQLESDFDSVVFLSEYSLEQALESGIRPKNPAVLNPGIEQGRFRPLPKRDAVLFTGKFDNRKGVFEVLKVARALPSAEFWLYGWGPEEAELRRQAPPNAKVITYSDTRAAELPELAGQAHICLLPSKAETFGLALIQAMAAGCAIVSSIPLPFEGFHVAPEDTSAMIGAVQDLLADPERCRRAQQRNVELASEYTWDRFAMGLETIYHQLLNRTSRA